MKNIKYKTLSKEQIIISADRLTRFKETEIKYLRVFKDILTNNLLEPKYKKSELDEMDYATITHLAEFIINKSLKTYVTDLEEDYVSNQRLYDYECKLFKQEPETKKLLANKINYKAITKLFENEEDIPINLKWLKVLVTSANPNQESHNSAYQFPIEKLIICEGITEETLLPEFAKLIGYDFNKNGIHILSAGGKNQVVKTFYRYAKNLCIPIFVLLDSDAGENYNQILPRLRKSDKIHIINKGEFEDILPIKLVEKTLKYAIENISLSNDIEIEPNDGMVNYLENFFKNRGAHEFKKAEFAQLVKKNITSEDDVSEEFRNIIEELKAQPILDY